MPHMPQEELSFTYFPENYRWSHGLLIGLNMAPWGGAEIGEINRIGLRLKNRVGDDNAWFREWAREARTVEDRGRERIADGRTLSGAQYLQRASAYYHVGERFLQPKSKEGLDAYMRGVDCLREAAKHIKRPRLEHVEIPYEGTSIPAIYVHAEPARSGGKVPAMVFFDGLDVTKEIQYFKGVSDLVARGIACLIVDGPGNGESIRFRNLYLHHETERYATRLLCAARRRLRAALRLLHRLGRAVGLRENLAPALRAPGALRHPRAVGRLAAHSVGGQCNLPGGGAQAA
jgi:hypothetical protein